MKALYVTNIMKRLSEGIETQLILMDELGYDVHIAGDFRQYKGDISKIPATVKQIDLDRSPFKLQNIKAFYQMLKLMKSENYEIVHCNTPVGGMLGRLCSYFSGIKKVIYQVHGFHFYKGASKSHNFIYENIERFLARFTDCIITINQEDFEGAKTFKLRENGEVYYVPGIGINVDKYFKLNVDKHKKRKEIGVRENSKLIIMVGDLVPNKNYETALKSISKIDNKNIECIICGIGSDEQKLKKLTNELGLEDRVHFLGFRNDVIELMKASDILLFISHREGLSRALMEAMSCGTCIVASKIRGNTDLIKNNYNGYLVNQYDEVEISKSIEKLIEDEFKLKLFSEKGKEIIINFSLDNIKKEMKRIYTSII
ncbi:glycosyltransferase [Paeniclostridium sordellii]|uniref:glycosyltransferase family 4 protein n=1 Tax=Paraclostridium sordellii TaxID=1505 RepID=UPI0005DB0A5D|nr:glycosyltransferase family 4 protein [Paeniclostridium sordellii]MVO75908.1 glycosyltransferase [Paeniclostridium sordellii]CEQ13050.1 group 1 glycosyl transferase [[Clostridium] sordellii] [Paeniclostridium sordellii]